MKSLRQAFHCPPARPLSLLQPQFFQESHSSTNSSLHLSPRGIASCHSASLPSADNGSVIALSCVVVVSVTQLCPTLCDPLVVHQPPLSMEFSRQEYWSGLPCPPPGDLPDTGIERRTPALQGDSLPSGPPGQPTVYLPLFILIYGSSAPGILSSEPQTCAVFISPSTIPVCSTLAGLLRLPRHSLEPQSFPCNFIPCLSFPGKPRCGGPCNVRRTS